VAIEPALAEYRAQRAAAAEAGRHKEDDWIDQSSSPIRTTVLCFSDNGRTG
jgi:hypothetical protein